MAKPSLTDVFGAGATQDATTVTIQKSSLVTLTASGTNTAESILMSILITAKPVLTVAARDADPDIKVAIEDGFEQTAFRGANRYNQIGINVTAQKLTPASAIDADDY